MEGGKRMTNERDVFSFDLNETLYFERGQEVSEMLGISLDPEISIQSYNEYISIRGVIELNGEYEQDQTRISEKQPLDFEEYQSKRFLEEVEDGIDGYAQFSHRFPVEISVPKYRVVDTDNITVSVESFDYELSNQNQLRINSIIYIHGISNQNSDPQTDSEDLSESLEKRNDDFDQESFQFEVQKEETVNNVEEESNEFHDSEHPILDEEHTDEDDRWKYKKSQSLTEFLNDDPNVEETVKTNIVEKEEGEEVTEVTETETNDIASDQVEKDNVEESKEEKGLNFLAKLFREETDEDEEEENYSQMRICIVQESDTLETIAERYEVPKLQLLKQNRLEDDDLSEGQLLSIPIKK